MLKTTHGGKIDWHFRGRPTGPIVESQAQHRLFARPHGLRHCRAVRARDRLRSDALSTLDDDLLGRMGAAGMIPSVRGWTVAS